MKKKFLSMLLVLSMICAFMPVVSNAATSDVTKLINYITKYGTIVNGYLSYQEVETINNTTITSAMTYRSADNLIVFYYRLQQGNTSSTLTFDYNTSTQQAKDNSILATYLNQSTFSVVSRQAAFDISKYTLNSTLNFIASSSDMNPPGNINELFNTQTQAAVAKWNIICTQAGTTIDKIGFTSYSSSSTQIPDTTGNEITISNQHKNDDTISFTAELSSKEEIQGTILSAVYDINGALTNIKSYPAAASKDISIIKKDDDYTAKIFWWYDTDSIYPMADYAEIKLSEIVGIIDSGTFGINNNLKWLLDDNGTLTISGSGQMEDFTSGNAPWSKYNKDIKIVVIENGVTRISKNAFAGCSKIKRVLIDKSVTEIEAAAFKNCSDLSAVEYSGSQSEWEEIYIGTENEQLQNANFIYNSSLSDRVQTDLDYLKYTKNEDNTITITNCLADAKKINIPKEIGGLPVTTIGENAFSGCGSLTRVTIPDSVTSIEDYAFSSCPLTNIIIPDSVTNIGIGIFSGCSDIQTAIIGNGVTNISEMTFSGCSSLESITIPDSVTSISGQAFYDCSSLTEAKIGNGVTNIGDSAFYGCSSMRVVEIGKSITSIGENAFAGCTGLKDVYITDLTAWCNIEFSLSASNPMIYADNLYVNNELLTDLVIPNGVTNINNYAFYSCSGLTSVAIPDSVTSIGNSVFYGCNALESVHITDLAAWCNIEFSGSASNPMIYADNLYVNNELLTDLVIPNGVTNINDYAFYNCSNLISIAMGSDVTSIGKDVFRNCNNLDSVYLSDLAAYLNTEFGNEYSNPMYYANKLYLNNKRVVSLDIPDGVPKIPDYAFSGCDSITSVTIPDSVTKIGNYAFYGCSGLTTVNYAGEYDDFVRINIGSNNTSLTNNTIYCNDLELNVIDSGTCGSSIRYMLFDNGVLAIGGEGEMENYSYYYYYTPWYSYSSQIKTVVIEDGITSIGYYAFYGCSNLTDVYYTSNFKDFAKIQIESGNTSFTGSTLHCNDITVDRWGKYGTTLAYYWSDDETLIVSGEGDMTNYSRSFIPWYSNMTQIKTVVIEDGITSIGNYAFYNCSGLTSVTIPNSVKTIWIGAFECCSSLATVYYTGSEEEWNKIYINSNGNNYLTNAEIIYNYAPEE